MSAVAEKLDVGGLGEFSERLRGGVATALTKSRPADSGDRDEIALRNWPDDALNPLSDIREVPWALGKDQPAATIDEMAERFRSNGPLLNAVLYAPHLALSRLLQAFGSSGKGLVDSWIGMCWTAEAAWHAVTGDAAEGNALLLPVAARLRFLVLSEPLRWRSERDHAWWGWKPDWQFGGSGALDQTFGAKSWGLLVVRCQEARRAWMECLDAYQSHPLLSQAQPADIEAELSALVFRHGRSRFVWTSAKLLGLSVEKLATFAPLTAEDKGFIGDIAERHLLPRFALLTVTQIALHDDRLAWRRARAVSAVLVVSCALAAVGCAAALLIYPAVALAIACYALICAGVGVLPPGWGFMWALRMPAASAVGLIALVALLPSSGWLTASPGGWLAVPVLVAVSFGYLLAETRNHGVAPAAASLRALVAAVLGAVHALLVSLIGLVAVAAAYVQSSGHYAALWRHPGYRHTGLVLALATAWCLAVGVFSQILWDDRPITAPLAHLSWRSR